MYLPEGSICDCRADIPAKRKRSRHKMCIRDSHITDSTSSMDEFNQPQVNISLDSALSLIHI